jgi:succinylglutamate desuccinylase
MTQLQAAFGADTPRLVGSAGEARGGPLLLATAAIHGNEPAGVHALRRVFAALAGFETALAGRFVGLVGNRGALLAGQRYLDGDLNRLWSQRRLAELAAGDPTADTAEQREQRQLLAAIEAELAAPHGEVVHMDLHSTSGDSPPFLVQNGDARSLELARALGVPVLHGLLRNIDGTVLDLGAAHGWACVVLEGGQNEAETTIEHHESALWLMLHAADLLADEPRFELARHRERIARSTAGLPPAAEICLRYAIEPQERFTMLPGFKSFERVVQGQLLALGGPSGRREIRSPMGGLLIMPRYQGQGQDGFFLARPVGRVA